VNPERCATIRGHLVEQFRWHDCPICYVDAHRVSGSFDHAVADLQAAGWVLPGVEARTPAALSAMPELVATGSNH
jgi:hypothetical protein